MPKTVVLMLLGATVALSMGAALPQPPTLQPGPDPYSDQSSTDTHNQPSEGTWMSNAENNEKYNENVNKMQAVDVYDPTEDEWFSYQKQPQDYLYDGDSYAQDMEPESDYEPLLPTVNARYSEDKDILVGNGQAYYLYDTHMAAKSPFDYVTNRQNCLYKAMLRSSSGNAQLPEVEGAHEIPGDLIFENEDKRKVQKRIFSLLSRVNPMAKFGPPMHPRRYPVVYMPHGTQNGQRTTVARARHHHPTGQFVRWG